MDADLVLGSTTVILPETYFAANNVFRLVLIVSKKDAM
jgi:hypothetical protein